MAESISSIKGMTKEVAAKMLEHKISTCDDLLAACTTDSGKRKLAEGCGIEASQLTEYLNRADLSRIKGVAGVYADLLENAGVDTVREMSHRVPANLHAKLEEVNKTGKHTQRVPTLSMVEAWVKQAKEMIGK